ncbi:MAG: SDR family NAD(P)-dependent oxidoreductase [Candidatus Sulfotelmatobacter sp.]
MTTEKDSKTQADLITSASGGIGYELVKLFARDRYNLVLVARSGEKLNQVAAELKGTFGVAVKTIVLDLTAAPAAKFLFDQFAARRSGSGCSGEQRRVW